MSNNTSIVICGEKFDIGTKVILWNETGGLNSYKEDTYYQQDRKTGKTIKIAGKRYGKRSLLNPNPTLEQLKPMITQFFLHHTGNRKSQSTYETLQKERSLSVTFIADDNGDLYQCLDVKEKAYHGGLNNSMSIGIEICSRASASKFPNDYDTYHQNLYHVLFRKKRIDRVQGMTILGYEYNDLQYNALIKLGYVLTNIFPNLKNADFPRSANKRIIKSILPAPLKHIGYMCHYHASRDKWDPVSFDHQRFLNGMKDGIDHGSTFKIFDTDQKKQEALTQLGYNLGIIDGIWGPKSIQALKDFQKDNFLKIIGTWDAVIDYWMDINLKEKGL